MAMATKRATLAGFDTRLDGTHRRALATFGTIALVTGLAAPVPSTAGPDACAPTAPTAYLCQGDQSNGITVSGSGDVPGTATSLTIDGLTAEFGGLEWMMGVEGASNTINIDTGEFVSTAPVVFQNTTNSESSTAKYTIDLTTPSIPRFGYGLIGRANSGKTNFETPEIVATFSGPGGTDLKAGTTSILGIGGAGGADNLNGVTAGRGSDITAEAVSSVAISGTDPGPDSGVLSLLSVGGMLDGTDTSSRGGTGGNLILKTDTAAGGSWNVTTSGNESTAVLMQSAGGFVPGKSGAGGHGGTVSIEGATVSATTTGDDSHGIVLKSEGLKSFSNVSNMPGGNGGDIAADGVFTVSTEGLGSDGIVAVSSGGAGGPGASGGDGANVSVTTEAGSSVATTGDQAVGIAGQSIAGRGGNAKSTGGVVAFGATGGASGRAGAVTFSNEGAISTSGYQSAGMLAQSVGGSGGHGGSAFGLFYAKGGAGGAGGAGSPVILFNSGTITTDSHASIGMEAQSVGGTGGAGGGVGALAAMGGGSGSGGAGGTATVNNTGTIRTGLNAGDAASDFAACPFGCSYGILAQSLGGGGGNGGSSGGWFSVGGAAGGGGSGDSVVANNTGGSVSTALGDSTGILGQSIGGGGGNGGASVAAGLVASVAVGGTGGNAGNGADVTIKSQNAASVATAGDRSHAIHAQSVGGGGGNGGFSVAAAASSGTPAAAISIGGSGATGGTGGPVFVDTTNTDGYSGGVASTITTTGAESHGLFAQSIGGGGGNGGVAVSAAATEGSVLGALTFGVGGGGGSGNSADTAGVSNGATLSTIGDKSIGAIAQSIGGSGGNGGLTISGSLSIGGNGVAVAVGGTGGSGGHASASDVYNTDNGSITTSGVHSAGMVAQSIGGGGGNGGGAVAATATLSGSTGTSLGLAVGRTGGIGGNAFPTNELSTSLTAAENEGSISTTGALSDGIIAQSIGGGGGNGGFAVSGSLNLTESNSVEVALGGGGGTGAAGGLVQVTNVEGGSVSATGNASRGIVAQSIGGGGGNGGMAVTGTFSTSEASKDFSLALGGTGGTGSKGNTVKVTNAGDVTTGTFGTSDFGDNAAQQGGHGILAQSIGGGGGSGGLSVSGSKNQGSRSLSVTIGGEAGSGAGGGIVSVTNTASVTTLGTQSDGILAQSIAGGGGTGGGSLHFSSTNEESKSISLALGGSGGGGGKANWSAVDLSGADASVNARGFGSRGVVVQSIGGGGGNGGSNHYVSGSGVTSADQGRIGVGGSGGSGSNGGAAELTMSGGSVTTGSGTANATSQGTVYEGHGVVVQSIGGGGGSGGTGIWGDTETSSEKFSATVGVGGSGGGSSTGGLASVGTTGTAITGAITTTNYRSHGVLAQSIGGGGGTGGIGINGAVTNKSANGLAAGIGGAGGAAGAGGQVIVNSAATITTEGSGSKGIMAQSIGGGGGAGGTAIEGKISSAVKGDSKQVNVGVGGAGGGGGSGNRVTVINSGAISTGTVAISDTLSSMDAIYAQSVGGGGGDSGVGIKGAMESSGTAKNMELTLGISLAGGKAGAGDAVSVINSGKLVANGSNTRGILAQSIGGGGGNGNVGIDGDLSASSDEDSTSDTQVDVGLGGKAGGGGNGGRAAVSNTNSISVGTLSDGVAIMSSVGILAQSIGGGGGNGGVGIKGDVTGAKNSKTMTVAVGGAGGGGGSAATGDFSSFGTAGVAVSNSGAISVLGSGGHGIHAQSVGGGGGNAGLGLNGKVSSGDGKSLTIALGLSGGTGGTGGSVFVENDAAITTGSSDGTSNRELSDAHGILAQSIGGGGGTGILTGGLIYGDSSGQTIRGVDFALGGTSATSNTGSAGGSILVTNTSDVTTYFNASHGILAQSVGGGGGHVGSLGGIGTEGSSDKWAATVAVGGGGSAGNGGTVVAYTESSSAITTHGAGSHGLVAQSVGGGGGTSASAAGLGSSGTYTTENSVIGITLGGSERSTGNGGAVGIAKDANGDAAEGMIVTKGSDAIGILAQSIGGGGGTGGVGLQGATGSKISLGAKTGASGNAGAPDVRYGGSVTTSGTASHGIVVQSIGGGGGLGGSADFVTGSVTSKWGSGLSEMGSDSTNSGNGGPATVMLDAGSIVTSGDSALGMFVQSVGGGGGLQGSATSGQSMYVGSAGGKGNAGIPLAFLNDGSSIVTNGDYAHGIFLQSAGGSASSGSGGEVFVTVTGSTIRTNGTGAVAIIAQSSGQSKTAVQISIDAESELLSTQTAPSGSLGSTVWVLDGLSGNRLTNAGTIGSTSGAGNMTAVRYTGSADLTVDNTGTIVGNFVGDITEESRLSASATQGEPKTHVINRETGSIVTSGLSTFDQITNSGMIEIGGISGPVALAHSGDKIVNKSGGTINLDLGSDLLGGAFNDFVSTSGVLMFELGSMMELASFPDFDPIAGAVFDLAFAADLIFETEDALDFDLFDYVQGSLLSTGLWDLSILTGLTMPAVFDDSSFASSSFAFEEGEALRLSYHGSVPLPGTLLLFGPGLIIVATARLRRRRWRF